MNDGIDLTSDLSDGTFDGGHVPANLPAEAQGGNMATPPGTQLVGADTAAPAKQAEAKEPSLRDRLSSAFKGEDGKPSAQTDAQSNNGQPRGADGKFAPKTGEQVQQGAQGEPAAQTATAVQAPAGMSPAELAQFSALPAETQQFVARTMEAVGQQAARYEGLARVEQVIGPRVQAWAMNGMVPEQALNHLFSLSDFASTDPAGFIRHFASQQNIDLADLALEIDAAGGGSSQLDPNYVQLQQQLGALQQQVGQFTNAQQEQQQNAIKNEVVTFASETGQDGKPLHPYFEELGAGLPPFVQMVKAENPSWSHRDVLNEAYDRACWASPTVRAKVQAAEQARTLAAQAANVAAARHAGASVTGAPAGGSDGAAVQPGDTSVRGLLRQQFAAAGNAQL